MMSRSATPIDLRRSMNAVDRLATSAVACATLEARISAPSVTTTVSGFATARPIPRTEMMRGFPVSGLGIAGPAAWAGPATIASAIMSTGGQRARPRPAPVARAVPGGLLTARPRQPGALRAGAFDLVHRLRRPRGEDLAAVGGDQDVVLDPHADAEHLARDGVLDLLGAGL